MPDHAAHGGADLGGAGGIGFHSLDLAAHPLLERGAQLRAVGAHLLQLRLYRCQQPARHRGAERPADQPPALFAHPLLDGRSQHLLLARDQRFELAQHEAEHLLMAPALDDAAQPARDQPSGGGAAEHARQQPGENAPRAPVLHRGQHPRKRAGERLRRRPGRDRIGKKAVQHARQVQPMHDVRHLGAGEDVVGDEPPERAAQPFLFVRNDRGVRDRDAEWMAEQRRHREPVGDAADEARLGRGQQPRGSRRRAAARSRPPSGSPSGTAARWRRPCGETARAERRHRGPAAAASRRRPRTKGSLLPGLPRKANWRLDVEALAAAAAALLIRIDEGEARGQRRSSR